MSINDSHHSPNITCRWRCSTGLWRPPHTTLPCSTISPVYVVLRTGSQDPYTGYAPQLKEQIWTAWANFFVFSTTLFYLNLMKFYLHGYADNASFLRGACDFYKTVSVPSYSICFHVGCCLSVCVWLSLILSTLLIGQMFTAAAASP